LKIEWLILLVVIILISPYYVLSFSDINITPSDLAVVSYGFSYNKDLDDRIGASCTNSDGVRTYMKYDLSELNLNVEKATLWFYKEKKNNPFVMKLGFYYVEDNEWNSAITWSTQPCESVWESNSNCSLEPFYTYKPGSALYIWEIIDVTNLVRNDDVVSFLLKVVGKDTGCKVDQWIYYNSNTFLNIEGCIPY